MGYTIKIGNAVPFHSKEHFPTLSAGWEVEKIFLPDAPIFLNDPAENSNTRWPSYIVWHDFCIATGLYDLFYYQGNLRARHPGCIGIIQEDVNFVTAALTKYKAKATLPPGFEDEKFYFEEPFEGPPNYDYHLARLMWLEWWMQWAFKNCETPAIQNY